MLSELWGRITGKDAGKHFPQQQGQSLGRVGDTFPAQPYGLYANLPDGQLFKVLDADGQVVLGVTVKRPSGVEQAEVSLWHPGTGSLLHFKNNGDLNIDTAVNKSGNLNINTTNANIIASGDIVATAGGDVEMTCTNLTATASANADISCVNSTIIATTKITFDTPLGQFSGNLTVDGNLQTVGLTASGPTALTSAVTSDSINIGSTHIHSQANDSNDNIEVDTGFPHS